MNSLARVHAVLGVSLVLALGGGASAATISMSEIDSATFASLVGDPVASLSQSFDFDPQVNGGDGLVVSTVYAGAGAASGQFVYTYSIELFDAPPASVGVIVAMSWEFGTVPTDVAGIGQSFYVGDDGGDVAPWGIDYRDTTATVMFSPQIHNGERTHFFGLVSPNAPGATTAQLYDSGAQGGQTTVLSNGQRPPAVPEPSSLALYAMSLLLVPAALRRIRR